VGKPDAIQIQRKYMERCRKPRKGTRRGTGILPARAANLKTDSIQKELLGIFGKLGVIALVLCTACQETKTATHPQLVGQTPNYLTAGDVVKITFPAAPELNQSQKIGTDGTLSLPLVGEVHAAGKSPGELQRELANLYKPQLQDSEVTVTVETRAIPVVISGAVQKPGKIVFERPATVLEAIMEAGGFTPEADLKKVFLIRIVKGEHETQTFDFRPILKGKPAPAIYCSGGDVIYVPEKLLNF
jgi:polysaccharide export outer membrane protein